MQIAPAKEKGLSAANAQTHMQTEADSQTVAKAPQYPARTLANLAGRTAYFLLLTIGDTVLVVVALLMWRALP
jgi:hypothetical protein